MSNPQCGQSESSTFATSGLSRVLDGLGRTRGSSATPEVFPPTPNRGGFQNPLDSMSSRFNQDSNANYNMSPNTNWSGSSSMAHGTPVHNRHTSNSTHMSSQSQGQRFTGSGISPTVFGFPARPGQGQAQSQSGPSVPPVSTTNPVPKATNSALTRCTNSPIANDSQPAFCNTSGTTSRNTGKDKANRSATSYPRTVDQRRSQNGSGLQRKTATPPAEP